MAGVQLINGWSTVNKMAGVQLKNDWSTVNKWLEYS
jgi:hypothetical protein